MASAARSLLRGFHRLTTVKLIHGPSIFLNSNAEAFHTRFYGQQIHSSANDRLRSHVSLPSVQADDCPQTKSLQKKKRKFKGKRAAVKWLKNFRFWKKKEYERMSPEQKILYKLKKARRKEERLTIALKKLEPKEPLKPLHDPEILTPEEHFYFLTMGHKCKNYVPVGKRGIFGGVILNIHLHWKKHQTVKLIVKTFPPEEVKEIASELAKLTGGIVLDVYDGNKIIMYRGRNYSQPPTEIMTPRISLSKNKALTKASCKDSLRAVKIFIARLEKDLEELKENVMFENQENIGNKSNGSISEKRLQGKAKEKNTAIEAEDVSHSSDNESDDVLDTDFDMDSDYESLSDLFEVDTGMDTQASDNESLYLGKINAATLQINKSVSSIKEHSSKCLKKLEDTDSMSDDQGISELDEVDHMFLRADSLLKSKK